MNSSLGRHCCRVFDTEIGFKNHLRQSNNKNLNSGMPLFDRCLLRAPRDVVWLGARVIGSSIFG
jgi:hypothetical protein